MLHFKKQGKIHYLINKILTQPKSITVFFFTSWVLVCHGNVLILKTKWFLVTWLDKGLSTTVIEIYFIKLSWDSEPMAMTSCIVFTLVSMFIALWKPGWIVIFSHNPSPDFHIVFHADTDFSSVTTIYGRITSPFLLAHSNVPILVLTLPIPVLISHVACSSTPNGSSTFL